MEWKYLMAEERSRKNVQLTFAGRADGMVNSLSNPVRAAAAMVSKESFIITPGAKGLE